MCSIIIIAEIRRRGSREGGSSGAISVGSRSRADSRDEGTREYYVSLNVSSRDRDRELNTAAAAAAAGGVSSTGYTAAAAVQFNSTQLPQTRSRQLPLVVAHHSGVQIRETSNGQIDVFILAHFAITVRFLISYF